MASAETNWSGRRLSENPSTSDDWETQKSFCEYRVGIKRKKNVIVQKRRMEVKKMVSS